MATNLSKYMFQKQLKQSIDSENITVDAAAWLINVTATTVYNWMSGITLPNRDNALKLIVIFPDLKAPLEKIAGVHEVGKRQKKSQRAAA